MSSRQADCAAGVMPQPNSTEHLKAMRTSQNGLAPRLTVPLRDVTFRRIWIAGFFSNLGSLVQGVGLAWTMTEMASSAGTVALVQTALWLPAVLVAMLAGALADVHDRRLVALYAVAIAFAGALLLTTFAMLGRLTPSILLGLCFVAGCGIALMGPAWQTGVIEQVPASALPAAVALNGISYNVARSVGPAIGGVIVAVGGSLAAFATNAMLYVPLVAALYLWERKARRRRLPPESLGRAILTGVRYISNSPPIKIVLIRSLITGMIGGSILALMPLVARDLLHGSARLYGILLSAFGMGAVFGALLTPRVRERVGSETAVRGCAFAMGIGIALMAVSGDPVATALALILAGSGWTMAWTLFNVGVQMAAPNWVSGRSVAAYSAASLGGFAIGSWGWGHLTDIVGVRSALLVSAGMMLCSPLLGLRLRMPPVDARHTETVDIEEPDVRLAVAGESGPISIEVEYRIAEENVDALQQGMQELRISRQRNGAYGWAIARDLADPERWIERFQCPTWHEYLRLRNRSTPADRTLQERVLALHIGPGKVQVRRMIDCPPNGAKA